MVQPTIMMVYITASNRDEARKLATALVEERLAACANIHDGMTSIYWWQGAMEQAEESSLTLKTRADLMDALKRRVCELHSYEVPCIVAWPIVEGHGPYLDWVRGETHEI